MRTRGKSENVEEMPQCQRSGFRHVARVRRAARSGVEMLHRSGAHEAVVGPERLHRDRLEHGSARRRHLPLRHEGAGRHSHVGQVHLSRNRAAGANWSSSIRFRTRTAASPAIRCSPTWPLEMLSTFTFEEQPGGKTKFTVRWSPLQRHAPKSRRPSTTSTTA